MPQSDAHAGCPHCVAGGFTYSERHRHECEARYVAGIPSLEGRRAYMRGVTEKRGEVAAQRLRNDAAAIFNERLQAEGA